MNACHTAAELGDAPVDVHFAGLVTASVSEAEVGADVLRLLKAMWSIEVAVTNDNATIGPTPGAVISLRHTGCSVAMRSICFVTLASISLMAR